VVKELEDLSATYMAQSIELSLDAWRARPWYSRFVEGLARLTATVQ
jgi:hypothetical protein